MGEISNYCAKWSSDTCHAVNHMRLHVLVCTLRGVTLCYMQSDTCVLSSSPSLIH